LTNVTEYRNKEIQQLEEASTENQSYRLQLTEKEQTISKLNLQIQEKQQEQDRLNVSLTEARSQKTSLQNQFGTLHDKYENGKANFQKLTVDNQRLGAQNKQLSDELALTEREVENVHQLLQGRKRAREAELEDEIAAKRGKNRIVTTQ
jgi:chromosome segregation ATPase